LLKLNKATEATLAPKEENGVDTEASQLRNETWVFYVSQRREKTGLTVLLEFS
jgi:hypothetical protein